MLFALIVHNKAMRPGPKPSCRISTIWSPRLAYGIGLLTADGCLINDGRHIDFTSKDRELVRTFKDCLGLTVKIGIKKSGMGNICYRAQFGDVSFYKFLQGIGLSPAKSRSISTVLIPDKYFSDFLRGYFDGDGTSSSFYDSVFPNSYRFYIAFISASPAFIGWLRSMIKEKVGAEGSVFHYRDKDYWNLKYAKRESILLSKYMYKSKGSLFLERKYLKIQNSLNIINQCRGGVIGKHATFRT